MRERGGWKEKEERKGDMARWEDKKKTKKWKRERREKDQRTQSEMRGKERRGEKARGHIKRVEESRGGRERKEWRSLCRKGGDET